MLYLRRAAAETSLDVSEDFTLPDYLPEIRRVVGVRANAYTDGKYLSGEELEADGGVIYTVMYVGDDGELTQTSQTGAFTAHIPIKTEDDRFTPIDVVLSVSAQSCSCRVSAPRKITLSSKLRISLTSAHESEAPLGSGRGNARRKTGTVMSAGVSEIRHSAESSGECREREGMRLISVDGGVCVSDVRESGDEVGVKGETYVSLLLADPDGNYQTSHSRSPIDEIIRLPDSLREKKDGEERAYAAFPCVTMTEVTLEDDGRLSWNIEYSLDVDCVRRTRDEIVTDAYLPGSDGENLTVNELKTVDVLSCASGRLTHQQNAKLKPGSSYVFAWGRAEADKIIIKDSRILVTGEVRISIVTKNGNEYQLEDSSAPFRYECDAFSDEDAQYTGKKVSVGVCGLTARADGDEVGFTCELSVSCLVMNEKSTPAVTEISEKSGDGAARDKSVIRVYVPDPDESEWEVEKKFRLGFSPEKKNGIYIL